MVHYPELAESKGLVLMVGEYDKDVLVSWYLHSLSLLEFKSNVLESNSLLMFADRIRGPVLGSADLTILWLGRR